MNRNTDANVIFASFASVRDKKKTWKSVRPVLLLVLRIAVRFLIILSVIPAVGASLLKNHQIAEILWMLSFFLLFFFWALEAYSYRDLDLYKTKD